MVSTCLLILKSLYQAFSDSPKRTDQIGITVTFMFHFFSSLARSKNLSLFSISFNLNLWSTELGKSIIPKLLSFLLTLPQSDRLKEMIKLCADYFYQIGIIDITNLCEKHLRDIHAHTHTHTYIYIYIYTYINIQTIKYIYNQIYIYLLLILYNSSIPDIEHSPN